MMLAKLATGLAIALVLAACGPPKGRPAAEVLADLEPHYGKTITIRATLRSGARCHQESEKWMAYCKDCQSCRGPLVVDAPGVDIEHADDWPMILGGTWEYKDIRCQGPLEKIECHPFTPGQTYVIRGFLERNRPPRLLVEKFWPAAADQ